MLRVVYALIALTALIATWSQNIEYLGGGRNAVAFLTDFFDETRATPASQSITADIVLLFLAAAIFMVIEARKHHIRFVWAYIVGGMLIAISVTFPLFLIARDIRLRSEGVLTTPLPVLDRAALGAMGVLAAAAVLWIDLA